MKRFLVVVAVGLAIGVLARAGMRVVAVLRGLEPEFSVADSTTIVGFFALAAVGGFLGSRLARRTRIGGFGVLALGCLPLVVPGTVIAVGETAQSIQETTGWATLVVVLLAGLIFACMISSPVFGWRLGSRLP